MFASLMVDVAVVGVARAQFRPEEKMRVTVGSNIDSHNESGGEGVLESDACSGVVQENVTWENSPGLEI